MAETPSNMIPLGTKAPDFHLLDTISNKYYTLKDLTSKDVATVVMFLCNHCPYVKYIQAHLVQTVNYYQSKGVRFIAISSNDVESYPADGPDRMKEEANAYRYAFPYLFDETQEVAKAYHAACTPDFFIFDKDLACVYRGRYDEATPGNGRPVTGDDLKQALNAIIAGKPIPDEQIPSLGCNIKWKKK